MVKLIEGKVSGRGKKICIVVAKFNDYITKRLLKGCLDELSRCGVRKTDITVAWVPGSYEIPVVAAKFAKKKNIEAVICLGAVIRGETFHFDLIAQGVAQGIMQVSVITGKPIVFGVLATDTVDQANRRSEEKGDNKGRDSAEIALEMISVLKQAGSTK